MYAAPVPVPLHEARRRWAELLRRIFEVDPLACPRCGQQMRIVAFITESRVIRSHPRSPMSYRSYEEPCGRTAPDCWFGDLWGARQSQ